MRALDPRLSESYDYFLPPSLIASHPILPKENARLLVYHKADKVVTHTTFGRIFDFLPRDLAVILNNTKVVKARIFGRKSSGGKIELLLNSPLNSDIFEVYIKGKVAPDTRLFFDENLEAVVIELKNDGLRTVRFYRNGAVVKTAELFALLHKIGHVPLPPYIKRTDTIDDESEYQSLFAKKEGAVAAPTASLHFSADSFEKLKNEFKVEFITLHVGAGTFKGVESANILDHAIHREFFDIPQQTQSLIQSDTKILAVGTTVARTVEYFARTQSPSGECRLFLNPLNPPQRVNALLTNFHLPRSTLIMLVAGFIGLDETLRVYREAVVEKYRFFSYGDAMLIV